MVNSSSTSEVTYAETTYTAEQVISKDCILSLTDIETFIEVGQIPSVYSGTRWKPGRECRCCAFSKDGVRFAWSIGYGQIKVEICYNNTNRVKDIIDYARTGRIIDCSSNVISMEFAPNISSIQSNAKSFCLLATGLESGQIKIWNSDTGEMVYNLSDHHGGVNGLTFAPCNTPLLVSCSSDKTLKVWDLEDDGNMSLTIKGHNLPASDCAFSPVNPHIIASVGLGKSVIIWRLHHKRSYELFMRLRGHNNDVVACDWSPDGALLASASHDSTAIVWDATSGETIAVLAHQYPLPCPIYAGGANGSWVSSLCFSRDGSKLATVCEDDYLRVWKLWGDERNIVQTKLSKSGCKCTLSLDGKTIAVGKHDGSVTVAYDKGPDILSLRHLSRLAARQQYSTQQIRELPLPKAIKDYLTYRTTVL